jgi:phosphoglycerate dehydrogenase-like enzyme
MATKALFSLRDGNFERIYGFGAPAELPDGVELLHPENIAPEDLLQKHQDLLAEVEVILTGWGAPRLDENFLAAAPKLRAAFYGAGSIRSMVTPASWERGIVVTSSYAANAVPVMEFTLAEIILCLKQAWRRRLVGPRQYANAVDGAPIQGSYGSTVGLVSLGMIGRMVLERLKMLEVEILAFDPFVTEADAA